MKEDHRPIHARIPGLGQRSVKPIGGIAGSADLCVCRTESYICLYRVQSLAWEVIWTIPAQRWNRLIGTIIGGFLGIGLFWVEHQLFPVEELIFSVCRFCFWAL